MQNNPLPQINADCFSTLIFANNHSFPKPPTAPSFFPSFFTPSFRRPSAVRPPSFRLPSAVLPPSFRRRAPFCCVVDFFINFFSASVEPRLRTVSPSIPSRSSAVH
ncbi:hypothetical protein LINPERHAP2_LOCUS28864 [Linum perenne]